MRLNWTSVWKVMTIWISRELPLFNFERLDILCAWIRHPTEKLWPFEFLESYRCSTLSVWICDAPESDIRVKSYDHFNFSRASVVQFRASRNVMRLNRTSERKGYDHLNFLRASVFQFRTSLYVMRLNWTSELKVMTIWFSQVLPLFNFGRLDMLYAWNGPPSEKLWPFQFLESFRCSISSLSIYYAPVLDLRVKSYDHLNYSRAYIVQFRASRHVMRLNHTSEL